MSPSRLCRARSCVAHGAMALSKLCRSRSSVALETLSRSTLCELSSCMSPLPSPNSVIQKPCPPAPHIAHLATAPRLSHASRRLRLGPAPSDGASCNNTSPLARKPLTPPDFPKRKLAPKKKGQLGGRSCTSAVGDAGQSSDVSSDASSIGDVGFID